MIRRDVIYLIAEDPARHGVFDAPAEDPRMVYCEVRSIGMNEFYKAAEAGLAPSVAFVLADRAEYQGERRLTWHGRPYQIIRTFTDGIKIEIYAEEAKEWTS